MELSQLPNLEFLYLHDNQLSGPIPSELGRLQDLEALYLADNELSGPIPSELGRLDDLEVMHLQDNQFTGMIPGTFSAFRMSPNFSFRNNDGLCLPSTPALLTWVDGLEEWMGSRCDEAGFAEGLFMVGEGTDRLYRLNPNTGEAKPVGEAVRFDVDEYEPYGLAAHNGTLYMTGGWNSALYTLDPETGVATRVGDAMEFGVGESQPMGLASHDGTLYMAGGTNARLYALDML